MKAKTNTYNSLLLSLAASALLVGCGSGSTTSHKSLYQWERYDNEVYDYLKGQDKGPEAQIDALSQGLEKIHAAGNSPPPGYHAQLGLLYAHIGKGERVVKEFETEKKLFPESATYMDFLLKKNNK
jgi:hypothetical protein